MTNIRPLGRSLTVLAVLCLLLAPSRPVHAADSDELNLDSPLEYFVHQNPGLSLLIRIVGFETEFQSRIFGPEGALIVTSRLSASRLGTLYQLVDPVDELRQLKIQVQPTGKTSRSKLNIELVQLRATDRESAALIQAYRLVTLGQKSHSAADSEAGSMGVYALHEASNIFRQLGMEEMRLWAIYFAAVKTMGTMRDSQTAIETAEFIRSGATRAGFADLQMAALLLEGAALSDPSTSLPRKSIANSLQKAQDVLERAATAAASIDALYQQAWAINRRGMAYDRAGETTLALRQYLRALELGEPLGDAQLTNQIRAAAADASERLGDTRAAVAILGAMNEELAKAGEDEKLSRSLFEQGRLLIGNYQYLEATRVLEQARTLEQQNPESGAEGPVGLLLAQAYYHLGQMPRALALMQQSIMKTRRPQYRELVGEALSTVASIHRYRGEYGLTQARRDQQAELAKDAATVAQVTYQRALDLRYQTKTPVATVVEGFRQAYRAGGEAQQNDLRALSILHMCSLEGAGKLVGNDCGRERVRESAQAMIHSGVPRYSVEGRYLWAAYLRQSDRTSEAIDQMVRLNADARFFRSQLPGVLGAWYWENRTRISQGYMSMLLRDPAYRSRGSIDGRQSFAALDQLRNHNRQVRPAVGQQHLSANAQSEQQSRTDDLLDLRSTIAEREQTPAGPQSVRLAEQINSALSSLRDAVNVDDPVGGVDRQLKSLARNEAVLTYYFDEDDVHAWVGDRKGIKLIRIPSGPDVQWDLTRAAQLLRVGEQPQLDSALDALGQGLVGPVASHLRERIFFIPAGPISGIPVDALRLQGRYLAEQHQIINILSPIAVTRPENLVPLEGAVRFFLAGNPLMSKEAFPDFQGNRLEMRAVADLFVGPNLHMVQGNALTADEFDDSRFRQAVAVHLASPARIDLATPANSKIFLSDSRTTPAGEYLTGNMIRTWSLDAGLVVLSATEMKGVNRQSFSNQIGLVVELLAASPGAVVCSLWSGEDAMVAGFMEDFYADLAQTGSPRASLYAVKRRWLQSSIEVGAEGDLLRLWSAFQLYHD